MKNFMRKLHLWVSVPFGLVITITCFTGAMLVFESEITALCSGGASSVEPKGTPMPVWQIIERVESSLDSDVEVTGVVIPFAADEAYKVNLSKPRRAALYVNQYTGEVQGEYRRPPFFDVMRRLHRWLMDSNPGNGAIFWGKIVVGASTLAFVVILLTGLLVWWPRNRKMLKNRLKIVVSKGKNRFWYDLHVAGGFYALLFLLAMALTGLTWSYGWYNKAFYGMFSNVKAKTDVVQPVGEQYEVGAATPLSSSVWGGAVDAVSSATAQVDAVSSATTHADAVSGATAKVDALSSATVQADAVSGATVQAEGCNSPYYSWQLAVNAVSAKVDFSTITVSGGSISVALGGWGNQRAFDRYKFDEATGEILSADYYRSSSPRSKAVGWVRTLHVGTWGGLFSKILYFFAALLGATLPLTGYYLWIRRLYIKRKKV